MEWEIAYQKQAEDWAQETEGLSTQPGTDPGRPTTPGTWEQNSSSSRGRSLGVSDFSLHLLQLPEEGLLFIF